MEGKDLIFRASEGGKLSGEAKGTTITEKQLERIEELEIKVKSRQTLTPKQREELKTNKMKRDAPSELGEGAKSYVNDLWLYHEKGYRKMIKSKYLDKGLYAEDEAISLCSEVDGIFYTKNTTRKKNAFFTGEVDIYKKIKSSKVIQDTKCSYDPSTFFADDIGSLWRYQGDIYMELWNADEFWLRKCLIDCPPHIYEKEKYFLKSAYNILDEDVEEVRPLFDQLDRNLIYSNNPKWSKEERVRTFKFERSPERFEYLMEKVPLAREYYDKLVKLRAS